MQLEIPCVGGKRWVYDAYASPSSKLFMFFFFLKAGGKPFLIPGKFKIKKTKCQVMHFRTLICIPATLPHHKKTKTETKTAVCLLKRGNQEVRFLALIPIQNVG